MTGVAVCEPAPGRAQRWLRRGEEAVLALLVIVPTLLYSPALADNVLGKRATVWILAGMLLLLRCLDWGLAGRARLPRAPVYLPFVLLLATAAVAGMRARNPALAAEEWLGWGLWLGLFAVVAGRSRRESWTARIVRVVLAVAVVVPALGLLQVVGIDPLALPDRVRGMPLSSLGNTNFVAHYLELVLPLALAFAVTRSPVRGLRALSWAALVLGGVHLVLAGSRGGWLGVLAGVALMGLLVRRPQRWGSRLLLGALVAGLLSPVASFVLESIPLPGGGSARDAVDRVAAASWARVMSTFDPDNFSRSMRLMIWRDGVRLIRAHPVLGVGPGHFGLELPDYRTATGQREWRRLMGGRGNEAYHAHNELLETWAEFGVGGAVALAWLLGAALRMPMATARRLAAGGGASRESFSFDRALAAGCAGGIAAACVHALFSFNLRDPVSGTHLWLLAGLTAGARWREAPSAVGELTLALVPTSRRVAAAAVGLVVAGVAAYAGLCMLMGDVYYLRGQQHLARSHGNRAILALRAATAWRGHEFRYHHELGRTAIQMRRPAEAVAALRRSLELHAHDPGAIRLLARALFELGRPGEAVAPLRHAVDIDPLTAENYVLLADALRESGQPSEAAQVRRQAMSLRGDSRLLVDLALDYRAAGKLDTALTVLEQGARTAPRDGVILGNLGALQLERGLAARAESNLRQALDLDADHRAEWGGDLAQALVLQGRLEAALDEARAAAAAAPGEVRWQQLVDRIEHRLSRRHTAQPED